MTNEEIRAFIERFVVLWEREDVHGLVGCYTEHARIESPIFHHVEGHAEIEKMFRNMFAAFGDTEIRTDEIVVDRGPVDRAVLVYTAEATHRGMLFGMPGTGRSVETSGAFVFQFEGDKIVSERRLYDFTGLLVQLGVLKAKAV